ncbi:MAG: hypothetical protein J0L97_02245 [Alphaproteobacteria bacterium]|nr:hypothetical protein [Alphaproteobacteria bacterium]
MALGEEEIAKAERIRAETESLGAYLLEVVRQRVFGQSTDAMVMQSEIQKLLEDYDRQHPLKMALKEAESLSDSERAHFAGLRHSAIRIRLIGGALVKMVKEDEVEDLVAQARALFEADYAKALKEKREGEQGDDFRKIEQADIIDERRDFLDPVSTLVYFLRLSSVLMADIGEFVSTVNVPEAYKQSVKQAVAATLMELDDMGLNFGSQTTRDLNELFGITPPPQQLT